VVYQELGLRALQEKGDQHEENPVIGCNCSNNLVQQEKILKRVEEELDVKGKLNFLQEDHHWMEMNCGHLKKELQKKIVQMDLVRGQNLNEFDEWEVQEN
jgi:hypothetical protein